ncbi:epithelial-stromal interaction protein 1-like [Dysidea avara]|uniref:epithelial-stromal interaction protein 1-like n=1 Tax=Dysidea avara TaxID=196820 RepID=UPI00332A14B8
MSYTYSRPPGRTRQQRDRRQRHERREGNQQDDMETSASYQPTPTEPTSPSASSSSQTSSQIEAPQLQYHGGYYVKQPNAAKRSSITEKVHQETAEYQAFRSKKKAEQCEALCQASPSKLGGPRLSDSDVASMREKQEKQARLDAKFDSIRKREKREKSIAEKRQRENEAYQEKKQKAREQAVKLEEKKKVHDEVQREEIRNARLRYFADKK